jgi:16S rRNA (cytosine967-C5)-methyltransferase
MAQETRPKLPPARQIGLAVLRQTLDHSLDLQEALDRALGSSSPSEADRRLATELVYGYLRFKGRIDYLLSLFLQPRKTPHEAMRILGLAAYEMLFLDRVPVYASVSWAVDAVRTATGQGVAKMANAVLRRIAELGGSAHDPALFRKDSPTPETFLSRFFSAPPWLVSLWIAAYGRENTEQLLEASLSAPPLGVRVNARQPGASELLEWLHASSACVESTGFGLALNGPTDRLHDLLASGLVSRQSLAAQEALLALDPDSWPAPIWDGCAGRGGKTFLLAERSLPVWASDINLRRLKGMRSEGKRLGIDLPCFAGSATEPPLKRAPGSVLLDAPCSGLGVISRRPDIRWKRTPADIPALVELQARMLIAAHDLLPPGGLIAYLTCTLNPAENEQQIERILHARTDTVLVSTFRTNPASPLKEFFFAALLGKT